MLSGLHFPNPREFCVYFFIFYIFLYLTTYSRKFLSFITFAIQQIQRIYHDPNQAFFILYSTKATSATMRSMFERLGFTPGLAASLEGNDHGINTLEEVVFLNDKDIDSLVKQLRRPGGGDFWTYDCWRSCTGQPGPLIANTGHSVSIRADTNLKLAVFSCTTKPGFQELWRLQALH
jgi:hypothetical protein